MNIRALLVGLLLGASLATEAIAAPATSVDVRQAWIRWLPANTPAAAYAKVVNTGDNTLRIVDASSPDYQSVSLMETREDNGISSMVTISHLDLPAHGAAKFAPGGHHIMLMHATHSIKPGDKVPITLIFADGSKVRSAFLVMPSDASGPGSD